MSSEIVPHAETPTAIEKHREQGFTREQIELIKRTVAHGTSDDELSLFLETAKRRGLDPFSGQIHAIMRWDGRAGREVMKIQTGIDGYRGLADRTGLVEWVDGPEWSADGETWVRAWLAEDPPAVARFTVKRKDRSRAESRVATWREYRQTNNKGELTRAWRELSATMLGKVSEAQALRAAFPETLGGIYTAEEMDQAHVPTADTSEGSQGEVDQPEVRRALYERFRPYYESLSDDDRAELWEKVGPRLYGNGSLGARFAATPIRVLEEIVETYVPDAGDDDGGEGAPEVDAGPDDDGGDDGVQDAEVVDDAPEPSDEDPQAAADARAIDEPDDGPSGAAEATAAAVGGAVASPELEAALLSSSDTPADPPAAQLSAADRARARAEERSLPTVYPTLNVTDVSTLIRKGAVTIGEGAEAWELRASPHDVWEAEQDRDGPFRKTVKATLDAVGYRNTSTKDVADDEDAPGAGETAAGDGAGTDTPADPPAATADDSASEGMDRREALRTYKRLYREVYEESEAAASKMHAARLSIIGSAEDKRFGDVDAAKLTELLKKAEEIHVQTVVPF